MSHFSEMEFLFNPTPGNPTAPTRVIQNILGDEEDGSIFIKKEEEDQYFVFKGGMTGVPPESIRDLSYGSRYEWKSGNSNGEKIRNYIRETVYEQPIENPYINLLTQFNGKNSSPSLKIRPSDIAYLRDLGVYPINRMVVLRRFDEGVILSEKLDEVEHEPISVIAGWLKPDDNFGSISFNESWTVTKKRLDELIGDMIKTNFAKKSKLTSLIPVPDFAQGLMMQLLKGTDSLSKDDGWDYNTIPLGDPNVLMEGPYRDPNNQNLKSEFIFSFESTYEQKFIGDVDPGAAMVDIIDNILEMGTSNMKYWLDGQSGIMKKAKNAISTKGSASIDAWAEMVLTFVKKFTESVGNAISDIWKVVEDLVNVGLDAVGFDNLTDAEKDLALQNSKDLFLDGVSSILNATVAKYKWEMKGSIELMTGRDSVTPWYLTIGNPYTPWLSTNHIIVKSVKIDTSNEVGFNDMPMWLKATFTCEQSRNLGKNEIIRMFNNSFLREYSKPGYKQKWITQPDPKVGEGSNDENRQLATPPINHNFGSGRSTINSVQANNIRDISGISPDDAGTFNV